MRGKVRTQVTVAPQAHEDMRRLGRETGAAVGDFLRRLRADRSNRSLHLVPLRQAGANGDLLLATVDRHRMALLLETEQHRLGLLAVRGGPRAHEELARLTVEINSVSGAVELIDQSEASAEVIALPARPTPSGTKSPAPSGTKSPASSQASASDLPLLRGYDDATLLQLGVIATLLPTLRQITTRQQLDGLLTHNLPALTRDVLLALREERTTDHIRRHITSGWAAEEGIDRQDWASAARRPVSQVSTEDAAVLGALGDGFAAWRVFLHPEQRRLATGDFKGSTKVTGGPGTGKTVVALHRVRHLVRQLSPGRDRPVLLTTYNTNLAVDLTERLGQLGGEELLRRVDVKSVDQLARAVLADQPNAAVGPPLAEDAALDLWHEVCARQGQFQWDSEFLDAEFKHVILAEGCATLRDYLRAKREGRGTLQRESRVAVWQLAQTYREALAGPPRRSTYALVAEEAARVEQRHMARTAEQARYKAEHGGGDLVHREAGSGMWLKPRYRHIVVDEAQDLSASHWRMLRAMVAPARNDIFLVGDAYQRIYAPQVVLGRVGIRTPGRASRRLTLNYRTTREILNSATGLVAGETFDDLDEGLDNIDGYRSVLSGLAPQLWRASDWHTETRAIATLLRERHQRHGTPYEAMAVGVPDGASATQLAATLGRAPFGIPATELGRAGSRGREGVRIGTMHGFKGLEFQRVFLAGVSEGQVPHQRLEAFRATDTDRYERRLKRARSLLYVAATRARDELVITWNGRPSRFLPKDVTRTALNVNELLSVDDPPSDPPSSSAVA